MITYLKKAYFVLEVGGHDHYELVSDLLNQFNQWVSEGLAWIRHLDNPDFEILGIFFER